MRVRNASTAGSEGARRGRRDRKNRGDRTIWLRSLSSCATLLAAAIPRYLPSARRCPSTKNATVRFLYICCTRMTSSSGARRRTNRRATGARPTASRPSAASCWCCPARTGGRSAVVVGLGQRNPREELSCWAAAAIPDRLPDGDYHLAESLPARLATQFAFGWAYGQYKFERYRRANPQRARQSANAARGVDAAEVARLRAATALARDLINTPANDMSPEALAQAAVEVARRYGATHRVIIGDDLLKERLLCDSRCRPRGRRCAAPGRYRVGRSVASEGRPWSARACASTPAASTSSPAHRCC